MYRAFISSRGYELILERGLRNIADRHNNLVGLKLGKLSAGAFYYYGGSLLSFGYGHEGVFKMNIDIVIADYLAQHI